MNAKNSELCGSALQCYVTQKGIWDCGREEEVFGKVKIPVLGHCLYSNMVSKDPKVEQEGDIVTLLFLEL